MSTRSFTATRSRVCVAAALGAAVFGLAPVAAAQSGWNLKWADEFNAPTVNAATWDVRNRADSFNNELQYYLPDQVGVVSGNLRITATDQPYGGKPYRSGLVESKPTLRFGRVDVRAKIPTTKGIWPAIWLLPIDTAWPLGGEIDIMEHGGSRPNVVSSAYHWGDNPGGPSQHLSHELNTGTRWPDAYHTYSVEWTPTAVRYFVDGVNHFTVTDQQAPISRTPMNIILNTAVGGDFDGNPNARTVFPQTFDIDYVRVYDKASPADKTRLLNPAFEQGRQNWNLSGNASVERNDLGRTPVATAVEGDGGQALKLYGLFDGSDNRSLAYQDLIAATAGEEFTLSASVRVNGDDPLAGTANAGGMFVEFYSAYDEQLGREWLQVADASTAEDLWLAHSLTAVAPADTAYLRVGFDFVQPAFDGGAVWFDGVTLVPEPTSAALLLAGGGLLLRRRRR